jgi:hypothetical protein
VLRGTTSRGLCGLVCPSRTGTREEPGTLTQGGALFSLVPLPTTSPSGNGLLRIFVCWRSVCVLTVTLIHFFFSH